MKRRTAAVLVACMGWSVASMAGAQTTTSSTSSSSTTTSTSTTSTTVTNPCAGQVCTDRPPPAFLSGLAGEVALDDGGYCWRSPQPNAQGFLTAVCADVIGVEPRALLLVTAGEMLTLRFGSMVPTEVVFVDDGRSTALTPGNPIRFDANLSVGVHQIAILTKWLQGDAAYRLRLDVRAGGRPIALTG